MARRNALRMIGAGLGLAVLAVAWYVAAPRELGGATTYAIIVGSSMEPTIERGDLVVVRKSGRYEVGDVAAYRSPDLGQVVLHRIVGRSGERFVFRGDANDFVDPERPAVESLVGTRWIQLPFAGAALEWLRQPWNAALLGAIAALIALAGGTGAHARRRRQGRSGTARGSAPRRLRWRFSGLWTPTALALLSAAALGFVLLGLVAFTRPTTAVRPATELYRQSGAFGYSAVARQSPVYDRTELGIGDALFVAVVREVTLAFDYRFDSRAVRDVAGTIGLTAEISDGNGWRRTFELAPAHRFAGGRAAVSGRLDLRELERLTDRFEAVTGTARDAYLVTVTPRVELEGSIGGGEIHETFAPSALFMLDPSRFSLAPEGMLGGRKNDLAPVLAKEAERRLERTTMSALGWRFSVATARAVAAAGGLAALAVLGLAVLLIRRRGGDEPGLIDARYGDVLVAVTAVERARPETVVTVATMAELARLADRYGRMILHEQSSGLHVYAVEDGGAVYRYEAREGVRAASAGPSLHARRLAGSP